MTEYQTTRRVSHSAEDMFRLVADVEAYTQFLPLCDDLRIRDRSFDGACEIIIADMTVAYKFIRETYRSRVCLNKKTMTISVEYLDGPFSHLENLWTFHPVAATGDKEQCDVDFYIAYTFRSRALQLLMGSVFDRAFAKFSDAFVARADQVYGKQWERRVPSPV